MRPFILLVVALLTSINARADDGPFGFKMGSNPTEYAGCNLLKTNGYYLCNTAPKAHSAFGEYVLLAADGFGICWVKGLGVKFSADAFGVVVKSKVNEISGQVSAKYGPGKLTDLLLSGSIWKEPKYWMVGLLKNERIYGTKWEDTDKLRDFPDIGSIFVGPVASSSDTASIVVEFYGKNFESCKVAASKNDSSKF